MTFVLDILCKSRLHYTNFIIIIVAFILVGFLVNAQKVTHELHFKDGSTKTGIVKLGNKKLKYRASKKDKFEEIDLSTFDYGVSTYHKQKGYTETWGYATLKKGKKPMLMEIVYLGDNIKLYKWIAGKTSRGSSSGKVTATVDMKVIRYFVQQNDESFATMLRSGSILGKSFEQRAKPYFKHCKELVKLIGTEGYKKGDIKEVIQYYDKNCSKK